MITAIDTAPAFIHTQGEPLPNQALTVSCFCFTELYLRRLQRRVFLAQTLTDQLCHR